MKYLFSMVISCFLIMALAGCWDNDDLTDKDLAKKDTGLTNASEAIFDIPDCISAYQKTKSRCSQDHNSKPDNPLEVFDPVRIYVGIADYAADLAREIIEYLSTHTLPDSFDEVVENGERIVITTPGGTVDGITYDKKIEVYTADNDKYFEINYMKTEIKGIVIIKPKVNDPTDVLTGVSIFFDGTDDIKVMDIDLTAVKPELVENGYLSHLLLHTTKDDNIITIEGGAQITDFMFGDDEDDGDTPIIEDHTYMIKAKADENSNLAVAHLGLPKSDVNVNEDLYNDYSISESFLDLFLRWVTLPENSDICDDIDSVLSTYDEEWDADTEHLQGAINAFHDEYPSITDNEFLFLLNLDNPVGFDSGGYDSNGDDLDPKFDDLKAGFNMDAEITPVDIGQVVIEFGVK
ncbi:MAG: hypothetical protein SVR08_14245 [Spirochaetota bacterium]|nr:hypothetical protein [Spirochaetota bacterium]